MAVSSTEELKSRVRGIAVRADAFLTQAVGELGLPSNLDGAVRYALLGGGKRVRPALAWLAAEAVGAPGEVSLPCGTAVELVHAFSLVHDDLPAMDDDDLRRGRPTLHIHAGEAMAILAGDLLLSAAFEVLMRFADGSVAPWLGRELAAGTRGMIVGQVLDTIGEPDGPGIPTVAQLERVHRHKTGALISAAARMGAIAGLATIEGKTPGERDSRLEAVSEFAAAAGLMFQVVDDLLDVERSEAEVGKRTGKDAEAGKLTYPGLLGVEGARRKVEELRVAAAGAAGRLGTRGRELAALADGLASRRA